MVDTRVDIYGIKKNTVVNHATRNQSCPVLELKHAKHQKSVKQSQQRTGLAHRTISVPLFVRKSTNNSAPKPVGNLLFADLFEGAVRGENLLYIAAQPTNVATEDYSKAQHIIEVGQLELSS